MRLAVEPVEPATKSCPLITHELPIAGSMLFSSYKWTDRRGAFAEVTRESAFESLNLAKDIRQINVSISQKNVLRGIHINYVHPQAKTVSVVSGKIIDVLVDMRTHSETFGDYCMIELSDSGSQTIYIPQGVGHGFYSQTDDCIVLFALETENRPEQEIGIRWDDPSLGIEWPIEGKTPVLSEKDSRNYDFDSDVVQKSIAVFGRRK